MLSIPHQQPWMKASKRRGKQTFRQINSEAFQRDTRQTKITPQNRGEGIRRRLIRGSIILTNYTRVTTTPANPEWQQENEAQKN